MIIGELWPEAKLTEPNSSSLFSNKTDVAQIGFAESMFLNKPPIKALFGYSWETACIQP